MLKLHAVIVSNVLNSKYDLNVRWCLVLLRYTTDSLFMCSALGSAKSSCECHLQKVREPKSLDNSKRVSYCGLC